MNAEIQNCIDAWALLYASIAKTLNQEFGAEGRSVLRKTIRGYASERGENRKAELCAENLSLNLKNLAIAGNDFPTDHRTEIEKIKLLPRNFLPMWPTALWQECGRILKSLSLAVFIVRNSTMPISNPPSFIRFR